MTITVRSETDLIVPSSVRCRAGIKAGDRLEFKVSGGIINIIPKLPPVDAEYTLAQRRVIDARLAAARKGPYYGPFETIEELERSLRPSVKKAKSKSKPAAHR
jgi:bifunctional DNA-binding transcriptional regulator/antitoxin component of YhaV-PrlF toxin-antitoxin module